MPNFLTPIHEFNTCHTPAGVSTGGQFCSRDEAIATSLGPQPQGFESPEAKAYWEKYWSVERAWKDKMTMHVSMGDIDPEVAYKLGWHQAHQVDKGYAVLPDTLYHVSTGYEGILRHGLKTRAEIGGVHRGLGGGADDTVSFTTDLKTARAIRSAILEARRTARGEFSVKQMLDQLDNLSQAMKQRERGEDRPHVAYQRSGGDSRDAYEMFVSLFKGSTWTRGQEFPPNLVRLLNNVVHERPGDSSHPELKAAYERAKAEGHAGMGAMPERFMPKGMKVENGWEGRDERFVGWVERKMTKEERLDAAFDAYKKFAMAREFGGGRIDPLFFMTDRAALAAVPVHQIKILQFKPRKGAKGYQVSALGEWRTHTGRNVRFTGVAENA